MLKIKKIRIMDENRKRYLHASSKIKINQIRYKMQKTCKTLIDVKELDLFTIDILCSECKRATNDIYFQMEYNEYKNTPLMHTFGSLRAFCYQCVYRCRNCCRVLDCYNLCENTCFTFCETCKNPHCRICRPCKRCHGRLDCGYPKGELFCVSCQMDFLNTVVKK